MEKMRFEKDKQGKQWVDVVSLTDEREAEIREQHTSRIIHFPEKQDGNARIQISEFEQILNCRRVKDEKGNVSRMEFTVLNMAEFGKQINLESIVDFGGWKAETKEELCNDVAFSVWLLPKLAEAKKQAKALYGGTSATKNS